MSAASTPPASGPYTPRPNQTTPGSWTTVEPPNGYSSVDWGEHPLPYARTTYQATAEQLARDEIHRRYMRRYVYLPLIAAVVLVVILFLLVVFLAFGVNTPAALSFVAGLSGLVVILMSIPLIILMTFLPVIWLIYVLNRRQQRKLYPEFGPMAYRSRLQIFLWQLDNLLDRASRQAARGGEALSRPLIKAHASAEYYKGFGRGIRQYILRRKPYEFEHDPAQQGTGRRPG